GGDLFPEGLLLDAAEERLHHGEGDVGFEQRQANFPQGGVQMELRQRPLAPQLLEDPLQPVAQPFEQSPSGARSRPKTSKRQEYPVRVLKANAPESPPNWLKDRVDRV